MGSDYLTGMGALYGGNERVSKLDRQQLYHTVNALNVTELYTLKWLIVGTVNFFLQFKKKKKKERTDRLCSGSATGTEVGSGGP